MGKRTYRQVVTRKTLSRKATRVVEPGRQVKVVSWAFAKNRISDPQLARGLIISHDEMRLGRPGNFPTRWAERSIPGPLVSLEKVTGPPPRRRRLPAVPAFAVARSSETARVYRSMN
jgi:hypothetical protein